MLGINVKREPVKGKFAKEIKERMRRIVSGKLSESDREEIRKHKEAMKEVIVTWK